MSELDSPLANENRKRVELLKKVIVAAILSAILIPTVFCIILLVRLSDSHKQIAELEERLLLQEELLHRIGVLETEASESVETSIFFTAQLEESSRGQSQPSSELNEQAGERKIHLTFDDGPSSNTNRILDVLLEYDVKATFFVIGKTDANSLASYRRIVDEGHTLGMHSYSHRYHDIYQSLDSFIADLTKLQELLYTETGVWSRYYRFPGGSSNTVSGVDMQELIEYLTAQNINYFDWNIASGDAASCTPGVQHCLSHWRRRRKQYSSQNN
jgi:peptidoglycan/xylan/chitin deacetylase (PgdA/CDA1 family)